jgi:hypothetical protein
MAQDKVVEMSLHMFIAHMSNPKKEFHVLSVDVGSRHRRYHLPDLLALALTDG